ncbi:MAG: UTP--glucose-1-phosphate uridylyltransferase [Planctomycetota bacterium]|jgi:UDP-N-acetylglucosamine/UDP-N-acetylgalactosamine diphosphorylase
MPDLSKIREALDKHGQEHLLRHYDELPPEKQRSLLEQINSLDLEQLDRLIADHVLKEPQAPLPENIEPPCVISAATSDAATAEKLKEAHRRGSELSTAGKVAAFVVAGGQGTRLGREGPKGCLEATTVTRKPLFQVFAEQIQATAARAARPVPWYVMTSPTNDVATRAFFRQHNYFGLAAEDVFFLTQGTMPAITLDGKILLAGKGELAVSPNGHGGCLEALRTSGALDDMAERGIEYISYFQVDNPLVRCLDPVFIGLHALEAAEMSAKCLPKRRPMERLGNICLVDGKVTVIEYSDMPEQLAQATTGDGRLRFSAGSIAVHVFSRSFVERMTAGGKCALPFHRALKEVPFVDESGRVVKPSKPNAVKLEMFVFDALPLAENAVVFETTRSEEFSPVKNASGPDSLTTSLHDQVRRAAAWLERAGISVPRDADGQIAAAIEISPLFADSAEALAEKVDPNLTITAGASVYLGPPAQLPSRG